jgi:hypothetical protein
MISVERVSIESAELLGSLLAGCAGQRGIPTQMVRTAGDEPRLMARATLLDVRSLTEEKCLDESDFAPMSDPDAG